MKQPSLHIFIFALISYCMDAQATCGIEIKLNDQSDLCIEQFTREYGEELLISRQGTTSTAGAKNGFFVSKQNPTVGLVCWINNGVLFDESFQIIDLKSFRSINLRVTPTPISDELRCMISDDENYFLVYDDFPGTNLIHVYNRSGGLVLTRRQELQEKNSASILMDGKIVHFSVAHEFGGFVN